MRSTNSRKLSGYPMVGFAFGTAFCYTATSMVLVGMVIETKEAFLIRANFCMQTFIGCTDESITCGII